MTIGKRIVAVRKHYGLSQQKFADRIDVKRNTVSKYEYDLVTPSSASITLICREFGVSRDWLMTGEGEMLLPTAGRVIDEAAEEYGLDEIDKKILRLYLGLGAEGRERLRKLAFDLVSAVIETPGLMEMYRAAKETPPAMSDEERQRLVAEYDALLKGAQGIERLLNDELKPPANGSGTSTTGLDAC